MSLSSPCVACVGGAQGRRRRHRGYGNAGAAVGGGDARVCKGYGGGAWAATSCVPARAAGVTHGGHTGCGWGRRAWGNSTVSMSGADVRVITAVLKRRVPCNLLVFGLGGEAPLWRMLNHGGRTVFLDVAYTTTAHVSRAAECRPIQNQLFSDCRLAINDLPNSLYDVAWDVILVDGPRGYPPSLQDLVHGVVAGEDVGDIHGGVLARTRTEQGAATDVLVHDYAREVESACSREFLCEENRVAETSTRSLAHFVVSAGRAVRREAFCSGGAATATTATP
ncbi:hypothetical protein GUJ93_ZPchr0010g9443 [Zizania palustris]|uniref:Polysaccharide biosynthesis domain-containing protein n=1 Tax=Zizania palustris TaxID=103762 RepID=A0A8J5TIG9_ZIZPA|nr:hypothetical protein GUJ93_ZPchr0010g9443 [Zizania palustris]